jgi:hypothetical protein
MTKLEEIARIIDPLSWDEDYWAKAPYSSEEATAIREQGENDALEVARAVIQELMKPNLRMDHAGVTASFDTIDPEKAAELRRAMLQAILDEGKHL